MPKIIEGPVTRGTKKNLIAGVRGKPLAREAVELIARQSHNLVEKVASRYELDVAAGEVGEGGSATASAESPIAGTGPIGLLYGRVQSGKTAAMILSAAIAFDNGFRIVVIVTANNVALVHQTANRFKAIAGPRVFSTLKDTTYEWEGQESDLKADLLSEGIVIVCAKDRKHLPAVMHLLQRIEAAAVPALIFDDEADAATPDTTLNARTAGRPNAPPFESTMYRSVIENTAPGQEGESIREKLPHHVCLQVTATPYVLFLQRENAPIRPSFVHLLEPGMDYCGGGAFFEGFDPTATPPLPPIVLVPAAEAQALLAARQRVPEGLANSCNFFLLAGAAHSLVVGEFPEKGYKHLSHTSPRMDQHENVASLVNRHVRTMRQGLRDPRSTTMRVAFETAYVELRKTAHEQTPPLDDLMRVVAENIDQAEVLQVNAQTDEPEFGPTYNFMVGGNILARGLTIDELLVTYYLREARTPQMDTVWQHARMYGYRHKLMKHTRVYLPAHLGSLFRQIHESEEELRELLASHDDVTAIPILTPRTGRPTRPAAIEPAALRIYGGARVKQVVPYYVVTDSAEVGDSARRISAILGQSGVTLGGGEPRKDRFKAVPLAIIRDIVGIVPIRGDDDGRWDAGMVLALLDATAPKYGESAYIYARAFNVGDDPNARRVRGVLSGPEVQMAEGLGKFVLALTYSGTSTNPSAWYPTLILPPGLPAHVCNPL